MPVRDSSQISPATVLRFELEVEDEFIALVEILYKRGIPLPIVKTENWGF